MRRSSALVLAAFVLALVPAGASLAAATCDGKAATIVGTSGKDTLRGTQADDVIAAGGGQDRVESLGGNDLVCGGGGLDTLIGGRGNDTLRGGLGRDDLHGEDGDDVLVVGKGKSNRMIGGVGNDAYRGGPGRSDLIDFYESRTAVDVDLAAGTVTGEGADTVARVEVVFGTRFDDTLTGDDRPNAMAGRDGNDTMTTGGGGVISGPGNAGAFDRADYLYPEGGDDILIGDDGLDVVSFFDAPSPVTVDLGAGTATGEGNDTLTGIEGVDASRNDDTVIGDAGDNVFALGGGNYTVDGKGGRDLVFLVYALNAQGPIPTTIDLGAGTITAQGNSTLANIEDIWGTDGPDSIIGDDGANSLHGRGGNDDITGGAADDMIVGGVGTDEGDGGAGNDTCRTIENSQSCEN